MSYQEASLWTWLLLITASMNYAPKADQRSLLPVCSAQVEAITVDLGSARKVDIKFGKAPRAASHRTTCMTPV
jgi:hypothetical protein